MKKFKKYAVLLLIIAQLAALYINTGDVFAKNGEWPKGVSKSSLSAESAAVIDINSGTILYEKNMNEKRYPASITKILTTLLCLENASLTDTVTFSYKAVHSIEPGSSHIAVVPDEKMSMEDCLYGIMLMSANEVCNGVAEHISGSIEGFVDLMNQKAKELGCNDTHFVNPNGLFDENHYTTAHDMALISMAAMKNPTFRKIVGTELYTIPKTNKNDERYMYHKHEMLHTRNYPKYKYENCMGGKTGYTNIARWTLVTYAEKDGLELACVVMKTAGPPPSEPNEYTDTIKLLNYTFDNYRSYPIETNISDINVENKYTLFSKHNSIFDEENSPIYIEKDANIVLPKGVKPEDAEKNVEYYTNYIEGENGVKEIGKITYNYKGKEAGSAKVMYDATKIETADINKHVSEYVNDLDKEITEREEEKKALEEEKNTEEKPFKLGLIHIIIIIAIVVVIGLIAYTAIQRARLRKKYLGSYGRYSKRNTFLKDIFKNKGLKNKGFKYKGFKNKNFKNTTNRNKRKFIRRKYKW